MIPTRPIMRWHGGKWLLAPWILSHFPEHRCYVEPFGGAGSVLVRKQRSDVEIWNDLDRDVVNLFEVLRSESASRLIDLVRLTPFSRAEFSKAYEPAECSIERARRLVVRCAMGFGGGASREKTSGFRANSSRSGPGPANDWRNYPDALELVVDRLRGVVVENRDALEVMRQHDSPTTLHYVDPPYLPETRDISDTRQKPRHTYSFEYTPDQHDTLLASLRELEGSVILSGYHSPQYDAQLPGWRRRERPAQTSGKSRIEVLWINPQACSLLDAREHDLLSMAAAM